MQDDSAEKPSQESRCESASKLLEDWRKILCRVVDEAENFTREKPGMGLVAAFFAGAFLSSLFRRR